MKQLTCEMCGSTDLMKQDGVFVCQTCGTKYTVEEAKKMMIEGTVDVQGTVKVDDSEKITNYYTMAENAYEARNYKEAENYCNKIIEIEPNNYKAWFLKGCAAGWQSTIANLRIEESINCFTDTIDNAPDNEIEKIKKTVADEISKLSLALIELCCKNYSENGSVNNADTIIKNVQAVKLYSLLLLSKCGVKPADLNTSIALELSGALVDAYKGIVKDYWGVTGHPSKVAWDRYTEECLAEISLIDLAIGLVENNSNTNNVNIAAAYYKFKIRILKDLEASSSYSYSNGSWHKDNHLGLSERREKYINIIMECHSKIKKINPNYVVPERPKATREYGCYVATCVYYDCPQVWTLRRYRDYTLAKTWYGRAFIHTYYAISPNIVKWFGHTEWFKKMWKGKLDRMVSKLQSEGIENTPYTDKIW